MNLNKNLLYICLFLLLPVVAFAGNKDRVGEAGASELLINPWARSSGMLGINQASTRGLESMRLNVGGLAFNQGTEVIGASTQWLRGSDVSLIGAGFSQALGDAGVLGVTLMSVNFGEIDLTTVDNPDIGTGGTYRPAFTNIGVAFSRSFSESIHGGVVIRVVNQSISDVSSSGVAFDAGIQYVTGADDNFKFGISIRNVGTAMRYKGDGLDFSSNNPINETEVTTSQRAEKFEMPSLLHIGAAYDFYLGETHRLTAAGNFTSNSFSGDQIGGGLEYAFNEMFMLRAGYKYQQDRDSNDLVGSTALNGFGGGATLEVPLGKESANTFGIDYSFRGTDIFDNIHSFGVRLSL